MTKLTHEAQLVVIGPSRGPSRGPVTINPNTVIIGTSGSTDYLCEPTGDRRFWPVRTSIDDHPAGDGEIYDEDGPLQYLSTRCFPDGRGDLSASQDDEYDDRACDRLEEID